MTSSTLTSKTPLADRARHSVTRYLRSVIPNSRPNRDEGYDLVPLLVVMSLLALAALAAASNVRQQGQREREKEAIFRGEQVADAIRSYYRFRGAQGINSLPTEIDQLLEGI